MNMNKKVCDSVLDLIGNTPLIKLHKTVDDFPCDVLAKVEAFNPGHSAKDRIAKHIIEAAEQKGLLKPGSTIVETTSGNTGFSLAMVSILKGYKCILVVSSKTLPDKIKFLESLGAVVHVSPSNVAPDDPASYYSKAKRIAEETPNAIYINQYFNKLNIEAHYLTTGPEIWDQTDGKITHLVACCGTGGTISGTAKFLKEKNPAIKVIGIDAYGSVLKKYHDTGEIDPNEIYPYRIEGLGKNLIPGALDFSVIDQFVKVTDKDSALCAREIALKESMLLGYTSGAALQGLRLVKDQFNTSDLVVLIFPDHGSRYMEKVYSNQWMVQEGFIQPQDERFADASHDVEKSFLSL